MIFGWKNIRMAQFLLQRILWVFLLAKSGFRPDFNHYLSRFAPSHQPVPIHPVTSFCILPESQNPFQAATPFIVACGVIGITTGCSYTFVIYFSIQIIKTLKSHVSTFAGTKILSKQLNRTLIIQVCILLNWMIDHSTDRTTEIEKIFFRCETKKNYENETNAVLVDLGGSRSISCRRLTWISTQ